MKIRQSAYRIYPVPFHSVSEAPSYYAMAHVGRLPGATWLLVVYILLTFCANALESRVVASRETGDIRNELPTRAPSIEETLPDPLEDLARVFGLKRIPIHLRNHSPPEYLQQLYESTTDADGIVRSPPPYHADTIYGYLNTANSRSAEARNFQYNVSRLDEGSQLLSADFHVFRIRNRRSIRVKRVASRRRSNFLVLKLYQILNTGQRSGAFGNRLIDVKRITTNQYGWIVFNAQRAVKEWIEKSRLENHGFLIIAQTGDGQVVDSNALSLAQRFQHHDRLQPLLAVYTNQTKIQRPDSSVPRETRLTRAFANEDPTRYQQIYQRNFTIERPHTRSRRDVGSADSVSSSEDLSNLDGSLNSDRTIGASTNDRSRSRSRSRVERHSRGRQQSRRHQISQQSQQYCSRRAMYVDFRKVGWDAWIISPPGFHAEVCQGKCPFPLGQTYKPTNHAVVQSIVHAMKVVPNVQSPCCVPHKLNSISMLYYDENYRVILKQYDGMVVSSCGCQ